MRVGNVTDTNFTINETGKEHWYGLTYEDQVFGVVNTVLCVLVGIVAILSNGLTLLANCKCRDLLHKTPYILVNCLAIVDMGLGVQAVVFTIKTWLLNYCSIFSSRLINDVPMYACVICSVLHVCAMTTERFYAISYPLQYENIFTARRLYLVSFFCWIISFLFGMTIMIWNFYNPDDCQQALHQIPFLYKTGLLFTLYLIVGVVFLIFYFKILMIIRQQARRIAIEMTQARGYKVIKRSHKGTRLVVFIMVAYLVCWGPHLLAMLMQTLTSYEQAGNVSRLTLSFGMTNSCINAFVYAYINQDYRKAYQRLLCCRAT